MKARLSDSEVAQKMMEHQLNCMELGFRLGMGELDAFDKVFKPGGNNESTDPSGTR